MGKWLSSRVPGSDHSITARYDRWLDPGLAMVPYGSVSHVSVAHGAWNNWGQYAFKYGRETGTPDTDSLARGRSPLCRRNFCFGASLCDPPLGENARTTPEVKASEALRASQATFRRSVRVFSIMSSRARSLYGPTAFFACLSSIISSGLAKKDCSRLLRLGYLNGCASEIAVATLEQDAVRFAPQRHRADIRLASRYCDLSHIPRLKPVRR